MDKRHFSNLSELKDFLNQFTDTQLSVIHPLGSNFITVEMVTRELSDDSEVIDVIITDS